MGSSFVCLVGHAAKLDPSPLRENTIAQSRTARTQPTPLKLLSTSFNSWRIVSECASAHRIRSAALSRWPRAYRRCSVAAKSCQIQAAVMTISLSGRQRDRFKADLRAHRETFSLNDAEYADQVLKVSLNTYKKCVQSTGSKPLAFKRHTFVSIFANTLLD